MTLRRIHLGLPLALGGVLLAQDAPQRPPARPDAPAPITTPLRDPFHSQLLAPPGPQTRRDQRERVALLGTVTVVGREACALVSLSDHVFVVRAGDRLPLARQSVTDPIEYFHVLEVHDGFLQVETGRVTWVLR